jgi:tellurite resistance protein
MISHHSALIYTMVLVSAADREMTDAEMMSIGDIVLHLPIFRDFERDDLPRAASACAQLLNGDSGLDRVFKEIKAALPPKLRETAYALACDVAAADGRVTQEEARILEMIRYELDIGRLPAAAIERGAKARHAML